MTNSAYEGPERRGDHDAIISMRRDMKHICSLVQEMRADIKKQNEICSCRMKDCNAFFVSQKVFYTALIILVAFVGTVGTVTYNNKVRIESHRTWSVAEGQRIDEKLDHLLPLPFSVPTDKHTYTSDETEDSN